MKVDAMLRVTNLRDARRLAEDIEAAGFDGMWAAEKDHDPFLLLALASSATRSVTLGTAIALAFTRSPMSIAQTAWNLQAASGGRFILGLGSQVRSHIERRFSAQWDRPVDRMREVILSLRAIWDCWRSGGKLDFQGEFYRFDLMTPAFAPPAMAEPSPPIYLGGVNPGMIRLAGALADGFHVHPFHSRQYLRDTILPGLHDGAESVGRSLEPLTICASAFCVSDELSRASVRNQLSFYASTKAYRSVLQWHGWEKVGVELGRMAASRQWSSMPALISDEMIETFAVVAPASEIRQRAMEEYGSLVQRLTINEGPDAGRTART